MATNKPDFSKLAESWPSPIVARQSISEFTGGLVNPRTLANLDCKGEGPAGRFKVKRKVGYPAAEVVAWLENRTAE